MAWEQQIEQRQQRARDQVYEIRNLGRNRVFSTFEVVNPTSKGRYEVVLRTLDDTGENHCTCPDFRSNTLGTCKHIKAVVDKVLSEYKPKQRRGSITIPELILDYRTPLRLRLLLPARGSDPLQSLARQYCNQEGYLTSPGDIQEFYDKLGSVPEKIALASDVADYVDRQIEKRQMAGREQHWRDLVHRGEIAIFADLLSVPLYEYQLEGAIFLACRGRAILGDDMGLGKTVQTMAAVELLSRQRPINKVLVIAPASVKYQWETEIRRFSRRTVQVIEGDQADRADQYQEATFYRLVNYEQVIRDFTTIDAWGADIIILDEAQRIKNWESKTARAVKRLKSRYAFALTGTPLENRLEELYSIVQFVDDRLLGPAFAFLQEHRILNDAGHITGYRHLDRIRDRLATIFLRRTRSAVLTQLPERTEVTTFVELAEAQKVTYQEVRGQLAQVARKPHWTEAERRRVQALVVQLRLICNALSLYTGGDDISPKLDEFAEIIPDLLSARGPDSGKILVFSQWEKMLELASPRLTKLNIPHEIYHGKLDGNERRDLLARFDDPNEFRLLLATDAASTGLNLQVADLVINLELPWNPALLEQRICRAHRMGQTRPVQVIHFVARGTIEERVIQTLQSKRDLFEGLFEGDGDVIDLLPSGRHAGGLVAELLDLQGDEIKSRRAEAKPVKPPEVLNEAQQACLSILETLTPVLPTITPAMLPPGKWLELQQLLATLQEWATRATTPLED